MGIQSGIPWSVPDSVIFFSYFFIMIAIGLRFRAKSKKSMSSYFLSGRALTLPLVIGTMMTTWYDGYSVVGVAEYGATIGIAGMIVYVIPCTLTRIPFAMWVAPFVRGKIPEDCMTVPDLMEYLYNRKAKLLGTVAVLAGVLYNGVNFLVIAQLVQFLFGVPNMVAVIISGCIVGIYVLASGMWSVTMTDVFQLGYMSISAGIAVIMAMNMVGGFEGIYAALGTTDAHLFTPMGNMPPATALAWALIGLSIYTEPVLYQRFSASDSAKTAKRSFMFCIPMWLTFSCAMVMLGLCAKAVYPEGNFYESFWNLIFTALPWGMRGLFAAGFVAAVMSSLSSYILVQSAACTRDLYTGITGKMLTDQQMIKWNKVATVGILIFSMLSTQAWLESVLDGLFFVTGFQVAGLFVPMICGMFYSRKTEQAGWITTAFGFIMYIVWQFALGAPFGIPANNITWAVSFVVFMIICKLTYKGDKPELEVS